MKELSIEIPNIKWIDIGGYEDVKQALKESVEWPIKYENLFTQMEISPPKGILLYGPPGCSKTLMAKAVATESSMNFISVKGPELFNKWVGESERAIRNLFRKARQNSPCVIFFDEIDAVGSSRDTNIGTSGVETRVLSQMLNEMDGIGILKQVIIIGATNRPDVLDHALLRPGRLDRLIYVPLPDERSRKEILKVHLNIKHNIELLEKNEKDIDSNSELSINIINKLAEITENYTGAEIAMICREASMNAIREKILENNEFENNKIIIRWRHLENSINQINPRIPKSLIEFYENYEKIRVNK